MTSITIKQQVISFLVLLISSNVITTDNICPADHCYLPTNTSLPVYFPFGFSDNTTDQCRGYPGFNLVCNEPTRKTFIDIPNAGNFVVNHLDYELRIIRVSDPTRCLFRRVLEKTVDFSNSMFSPAFTRDLVFLNCSGRVSSSDRFDGRVVDCLSGDNYSVVVMSLASSNVANYSCEIIETISIASWSDWRVSDDVTLSLTWKSIDCEPCLNPSGSSKSNKLGIIGNIAGSSKSNKLGIIGIVGILILGFLSIISLVSYYFIRKSRASNQLNQSNRRIAFINLLAQLQQTSVVISNINQPVIELYPKTLVGESGRLPNPNNNTCSICLSEYKPKETLRTITECNHYFHADCIDEWVRVKGTCPLCRKSLDELSFSILASSTSSSSLSSRIS